MLRRTLLACVTAATVMHPPPVVADTPSTREGIENARKAGIKIDPAAEAAMARAPIGSCPNDPSQSRCPRATAVIQVEVDANGNYRLEQPTGTAAQETRVRAKAAAVPQCGLNVKESSPDKSYGRARMIAQNVCAGTVTRHELYSQLLKFWNNDWVIMNTDFHAAIGGQSIFATTYANCTITSQRFWRAQADAYALLGGTWYAATQARQRYLNCG
jgi:hypothetical protein